jgi:hypothetical protein
LLLNAALADLPKSPQRADTDSIVRICELRLILPYGKEVNPANCFTDSNKMESKP